MNGKQLAAIRRRLGLSRVELARALGYVGNENTCYQQIRQYENGKRPIPLSVAHRVSSLSGMSALVRTEDN